MVLDRFRGEIDPILSKLASYVIKVNPDVFTWFSLLFAILAGLTFYLSVYENSFYLPIAALFVFINGLLDAIDGKVAKINKKSSPYGDFLDHAIDRYADIFIVGGLSLSVWCDIRIGFFAIIGMLLTSYMGTQAQAVGYKRVYFGLLGRADRLTLLMITPILQYIFLNYGITVLWRFNVLEWTLIYIAMMGNITALQRFYHTLYVLKKKQ